MMQVRSILFLAILAIAPGFGGGEARAASDNLAIWPDIKAALFEGREIHDGAGLLQLEAPVRAYDAAIVPITVVAEIPQTAERYIRSVHLIIDENPAPVAGVFHFTPDSGSASFSTRVRVNAYTNIRAIAETSDGELYMATRFVKAAGGCSAPALKDAESAMANIGKMKLKQTDDVVLQEVNQAQILISHPNYSGMQFDQITRTYIPAHFVQKIRVSYGDRTIMTVDADISLSENPSVHFHYLPEAAGAITVEVKDSEGMTYDRSWPMTPAPAS
ncbi:quinoprotein dehydrogenase-associated SoxYZ-like carrier [Rhodospirillaceae bacterium SYSU D60014]|uniref:quinoprotein dehydrogenase-associated SoxYZ-like carrier n=1 Tax=Virgifigura deserti TaxID=2268457 RepID=UPI0013C49D1D